MQRTAAWRLARLPSPVSSLAQSLRPFSGDVASEDATAPERLLLLDQALTHVASLVREPAPACASQSR
jgi:hypothetical protein